MEESEAQFVLEGKRCIVIGGQGEAEVRATDSPSLASRNLHRVAEQCGYWVGGLKQHRPLRPGVYSTRLRIATTEGEYELAWVAGVLQSILPVGVGTHLIADWCWTRANTKACAAISENPNA